MRRPYVSVFDTVANNPHQKLELAGLAHKLLVATNVNPKLVGGQYRLFTIFILKKKKTHQTLRPFS